MALTWTTFRTVIRRSILKDDGATPRWTNDMLADYVGWALDTFCAHTAKPASTSFACNGTTNSFALPANVYEPIDQAGVVYLQSPDAVAPSKYLAPVYTTVGMNLQSESGYYTWPDGTLITVLPPDAGYTLHVRYYAYYAHPTLDADLIEVPAWGQMAVAYMVGVHALSNRAAQEAMISQFDTKKDSGNPEDSAMRMMQSWWLKMYEVEMARHARQNRVLNFKEKR